MVNTISYDRCIIKKNITVSLKNTGIVFAQILLLGFIRNKWLLKPILNSSV